MLEPSGLCGVLVSYWAASLPLPNRCRGHIGAQMRHPERTCTAHVTAHAHTTPISTNSCPMLPHHVQRRPSSTNPPTHPVANVVGIRKCHHLPAHCAALCAPVLARQPVAVATALHTLTVTPKPLRAPLRSAHAPAASPERFPIEAGRVRKSIRRDLQKRVAD